MKCDNFPTKMIKDYSRLAIYNEKTIHTRLDNLLDRIYETVHSSVYDLKPYPFDCEYPNMVNISELFFDRLSVSRFLIKQSKNQHNNPLFKNSDSDKTHILIRNFTVSRENDYIFLCSSNKLSADTIKIILSEYNPLFDGFNEFMKYHEYVYDSKFKFLAINFLSNF